MTNDHFTDATKIVVPTDGATVTMPAVSNTGYTTDTVASSDNTAHRDAWWSYAPAHGGEVVIDVDQSTPTPNGLVIEVYTGTSLANLFPISGNGIGDDTSNGNVDTNLGLGRVYIRVSSIDDVDTSYQLRLHGPASTGDGTAIHARCVVDVQATAYADFAPPGTFHGTSTITFAATGAASYATRSLTHGHGHAYRPNLVVADVTAQRPADTGTVPGRQPVFAVDIVTAQTGLTLAVEYDTDATFATATRVTTPVQTGTVPIHAQVRVVVPLTDGVSYVWRTRVENSYDASDWTATQSFTVSALDGDAVIGATWVCTAATTALPHLWSVFPTRAATGSTVVASGTGFGPSHATVTVGTQSATVSAFVTVAADPGAYTVNRAIIPDVGVADPYHQTVTFTVPDVDPPGGVVYIDGS